CPSVNKTLPFGWVRLTTSGDFWPGAMAGPLGRLACREEMGVWFRSTRIPILTFMALQPPASRQAKVRKGAQLLLCWGPLRGFCRALFQREPMVPSRYEIEDRLSL